jgi:alpha-tubulin suppressor-like RCC1 family protein
MSKQILIVLGILLIFGCADVSKENQLQTGCSGDSESTPENVYVAPAPTPAPTPLSSVVKITAGGTGRLAHTCALLSNGTAKCWGINDFGQLGDGTTSSRNSPVNFDSGVSSVIDIDAGLRRTCAVLADGTVKCWGYDAANVFASGNVSSTTHTYSGFDNETKIDIGSYSACTLKDNSSRCWGRTSGTYSNVLQTVAGTEHICNLKSDKTVSCYGNNPNGEINSTNISNASSISSNGQHTCAVIESGTVECWGLNFQGQLGDGTHQNTSSKEVMNLGSVTKIDTSYYHSCAILSDQTVKCWGMNTSGQLGHGFQSPGNASDQYETASTVIDINGAIDIAVSDSHSCALLSNQTVKCWGDNEYGQLGNKNNNDSLSPVTVILN